MFQIYSQKSKLRGAAESKQGGRKENQDNIGFADTPLGFLLVVCDGMGADRAGRPHRRLQGSMSCGMSWQPICLLRVKQ